MPKADDIPLTDRQLEILAHVASGLTIDEAAEECFISPRTAYNVLSLARSRAGATTVTQLVVIALTKEWLKVDDEGHVTPRRHLQAA